jgi:hypothetical protein
LFDSQNDSHNAGLCGLKETAGEKENTVMSYVTTIVDPERDLAKAKQDEVEWRQRADREKAIELARQQFNLAFSGWRESRPEYAALVATIKRDAAESEIELAAARAGCDGNQVVPLRHQRQRALNSQPLAAEHKAAQAEANRLQNERVALELKFERARTPHERDLCEVELMNQEDAWRSAQQRAASTKLAYDAVALAKKAGLI